MAGKDNKSNPPKMSTHSAESGYDTFTAPNIPHSASRSSSPIPIPPRTLHSAPADVTAQNLDASHLIQSSPPIHDYPPHFYQDAKYITKPPLEQSTHDDDHTVQRPVATTPSPQDTAQLSSAKMPSWQRPTPPTRDYPVVQPTSTPKSCNEPTNYYQSANIALVTTAISKPTEPEKIELDDISTVAPQEETPHGQQESTAGATQPAEILIPLSNTGYIQTKSSPGEKFAPLTDADYKRKSSRICDAVKVFYKKQFIERWKIQTTQESSSTITVIAALVVEVNNKFKVVVLTAGTKIKFKCSYFMRSDPDESSWGLCDGHATAMCYRLASIYLLTEIYKLHDKESSIFEQTADGYQLKQGTEFHLFTSHPPCGFMANKERHFLSWKRPFVGKPHSLQCSSTILIGAHLGIQGPLSHLLVKPIYISSITMPRYSNMDTLHNSYIKDRLEEFNVQIVNTEVAVSSRLESQYYFHTPHVEIVDVDPTELFPDCYKPYIDDKQPGKPYHVPLPEEVSSNTQKQAKGAPKLAGTVPEVVEINTGINALVFTVDNGIGSQEFRDSVLKLKNKLIKLPPEIQQRKLQLLKEAQVRLSQALNVSEALKELKELIQKQMDQTCAARHQKTCEIIEQLNKTMQEPTQTTYEETKVSLGRGDESKISGIVNALGEHVTYQKLLDNLESLQEEGKRHNYDSEFYLNLMGCDWARYMKAIQNDINGIFVSNEET